MINKNGLEELSLFLAVINQTNLVRFRPELIPVYQIYTARGNYWCSCEAPIPVNHGGLHQGLQRGRNSSRLCDLRFRRVFLDHANDLVKFVELERLGEAQNAFLFYERSSFRADSITCDEHDPFGKLGIILG